MKSIVVSLCLLVFSSATFACEATTPTDLLSCFTEAFNSRDVDAFADLLTDDYTEAYVGKPTTPRSPKAQAIEQFSSLVGSDKLSALQLTLDGLIEAEELEPGVLQVSGIHSTLTVSTTAMDVGTPGEYIVENWVTWIVRETDGGLRIARADYSVHDPSAN